MANVTESDGWVNVTLPTNTELALGGNETNFPGRFFRELASRDKWLRSQIESVQGADVTAQQSFARSNTLNMASIAQGRLTLASGDAVPSADQTDETTLYYTAHDGDLVSLWSDANSRWDVHQFTERSLDISGLPANANYDIFLYDNSGTLTLQAVAWSDSGAGTSARASAISRLNGVWVKTSDNRRYLGTIRTALVAGTCEDSQKRRFVWNVQNRVQRRMFFELDLVTLYTYASTTWRAWNNDLGNGFYVVSGMPTPITVIAVHNANSAGVGGEPNIVVGFNQTNAFDNTKALFFNGQLSNNDTTGLMAIRSEAVEGYNFLLPLENSNGNTSNFAPFGGATAFFET